MNKQDIITKMAELVEDGTKKEAEKYLTAFLGTLEYAIENKEEFKLVGYFGMKVVERAQRNGTNPSTKEKMVIPATQAVKTTIGSKLKTLAKA